MAHIFQILVFAATAIRPSRKAPRRIFIQLYSLAAAAVRTKGKPMDMSLFENFKDLPDSNKFYRLPLLESRYYDCTFPQVGIWVQLIDKNSVRISLRPSP